MQEVFSQFGPNSAFIEELYQSYLADPALVGEPWISFFKELEAEVTKQSQGATASYDPSTISFESLKKQAAVTRLIQGYRYFGHLKAKINPLDQGVVSLPETSELLPETYGLHSGDHSLTFYTDGLLHEGSASLGEIISKLEDTYCESIGFEYLHLINDEEREFLRQRIEDRGSYNFSPEEKRSLLKNLVDSETLEASLHKRYVGHKRFSLEGSETTMSMVSTALDYASQHGVKESYIGMAHRGRLNILVNICGKPLEDLFTEFEDRTPATVLGSGDVKYHLHHATNFKGVSGGEIYVSLTPNPSHLEFVNPIVEGISRARQDEMYGGDRKSVLPFLLHGEAAFAGQGVVFETINFANTKGYDTGGTLHIMINNQIGFTATSDEQRGTTYCSDLAKGIGAPVFHVNSEDIEACCWLMKLAVEFRQKFGRDVFIDVIGYRKYGHNEGDDPTFTQPRMYQAIKRKEPLSKQYATQLKAEGVLGDADYDQMIQSYLQEFDAAHERSQKPLGDGCCVAGRLTTPVVKTSVADDVLQKVAKALITVPDGFTPHAKLIKLLEKRTQAVFDGQGIEWGVAEGLAFGSLLLDGVQIRLSGQDCGRGTFSHRHAALDNTEREEVYLPLSAMAKEGQSKFEVYNSVLSECGVMGFEYGYSATSSNSLVLWEGQFGDFANGAQVIIDQYLVSSEVKWNYRSGLVLLLPHGYEGQGPEHSSARLERYLQLAAEGNISVCYPSNSAQYFHLIRRQGLCEIKRPLIVMTPKSLLRLPDAACKRSDLSNGKFNRTIVDRVGDEKKAKAVFFVSGKFYYELLADLTKNKANAKIVRIEELYPLPAEEVNAALKGEKAPYYWVQEEPKNQGAWNYVDASFREQLNISLEYLGRPSAASTATGSGKRHAAEQRIILDAVQKAVK